MLKQWELDMVARIAKRACQQINPDNPRAVAESITLMYERLKAVLEICNGYAELPRDMIKARLEQVLAKVEADHDT